jgi:hypothetical protein
MFAAANGNAIKEKGPGILSEAFGNFIRLVPF